jgi:hypothetical protein
LRISRAALTRADDMAFGFVITPTSVQIAVRVCERAKDFISIGVFAIYAASPTRT